MSEKATLEIDGKKYEFPILRGSEEEIAIDLKTLRGDYRWYYYLRPGF